MAPRAAAVFHTARIKQNLCQRSLVSYVLLGRNWTSLSLRRLRLQHRIRSNWALGALRRDIKWALGGMLQRASSCTRSRPDPQ